MTNGSEFAPVGSQRVNKWFSAGGQLCHFADAGGGGLGKQEHHLAFPLGRLGCL